MVRTGLILLVLMVVVAFSQPDTINLNHPSNFKYKQRSSVVFPHSLHFAADTLRCKACHHRFKDGCRDSINTFDEAVVGEHDRSLRCGACHAHETPARLARAFHKQCIECHTRLAKAGQSTGPRLCAECHPKKR